MIDKEEFVATLKYLTMAFDKELTKGQVEVWYSILGEYDIDSLKSAIKIIIKNNNYFPSIAEVREEIKKLTEEDYSTNAKNEWGLVLEALRKTGYYKQNEFREMLKPKTLKVCERMGIEHLMVMESEEKPSMQKLFFNLYEGITEYEKNIEVYEENIKRLNELKQDFLIKGVE